MDLTEPFKKEENMDEQNRWLSWAIELRSLAQAGLRVTADRLIAVQDRNKHNKPIYAYGVGKVFVLCSVVGGEFIPNIETTETKYFGKDELPENLAGEKTSREQILMCFDANESNHWETKFD